MPKSAVTDLEGVVAERPGRRHEVADVVGGELVHHGVHPVGGVEQRLQHHLHVRHDERR